MKNLRGTSAVFWLMGNNIPPDPEPSLKAGTITDPYFSLTPNLYYSYAMNHNPFINWLAIADPWGRGWGYADLLANGHVNRSGDVISTPEGGVATFAFDSFIESSGATGRYRLTWEGEGDVEVLHGQDTVIVNPNRIDFGYVANGANIVEIRVNSVTSGPLTNFKVVQEKHWTLDDEGFKFNPDWLDFIRNVRALRFKDWMKVDNYEGSTSWADRAPANAVSYNTPEGVPAEIMIELCNLIGADPWFVIPHTMDNTYVEGLRDLTFNTLRPEQHVYVEYSNKVWDFNLNQAHYCQNQGIALIGEGKESTWGQFYGYKSADISKRWRSTWTGADRERLHTVLQVWTDVSEIENYLLNAPDWVALDPANNEPPKLVMTEYAVHGLIDGGLRYDPAIAPMQALLSDRPAALARMKDACERFDRSFENGRTVDGENAMWNYHKPIADANNMNFIMYEGGTHIVVPPPVQSDLEFFELYEAFHYGEEWATLMNSLTSHFYGIGGVMANRSFDICKVTPINFSGIARSLDDNGPVVQAWKTLQDTRRGDMTGRDPYAFVGSYEYE